MNALQALDEAEEILDPVNVMSFTYFKYAFLYYAALAGFIFFRLDDHVQRAA